MLPFVLLFSLANAATFVRPYASHDSNGDTSSIMRTIPVTYQCEVTTGGGFAVTLSRPTDTTVVLTPSAKAQPCIFQIDTHKYSLEHWLFDAVPDHVPDLSAALSSPEQQLRALEVQAHLVPVDPVTAPYAGITSAALVYAPVTLDPPQVTASSTATIMQIPPVGATNIPIQLRFQDGPKWLTSTPLDPSNIQKILIKDDAQKPHIFLMNSIPLQASNKLAATLNAIQTPLLQSDALNTFSIEGELIRVQASKAI